MPIKSIRKEDITKATENVILHQVNCQGKMGSGVALSIRKAFPVVYTEYMKRYNEVDLTKKLLGTVQAVRVGQNQYVCNLFAQLYYGRDGAKYTSYDALYTCLSFVAERAEKHNLSVAIPVGMSSNLGGAKWTIVDAMIKELFKNVDVTYYQYK